jgi:hypothetical protein
MIRCLNFRPYRKNTLHAYVDLELAHVGIVLRGCAWHQPPDGDEWVGLSSRPYQTKGGNTRWQVVVEFTESAKAAAEQFQREALAAIHAAAAKQKHDMEGST